MPISQNFPDLTPSLNLNFAGSKKLDSRINFTRGSTGTYMDDNGIIRTAGINQPRFDHSYDGTTIESLGLLIEEGRTNLLTYSEQFDNAAWVKQNSHPMTANSVLAPDGTLTADTFTRTATNQFVYQSVTGTGTYTLSAWVRSANATGSFVMQPYNPTDGIPGAQTFTATNIWQRFSITSTVTANSGWYPCIPVNTNETFYVWGAQLEQGPFPTSYIPTGASQVTRSADNASITGTNFNSWYNYNEGTFFTKASFPYPNNVNTNYSVFSVGLYPGGASMEYFITFTDYPRFSYFNSGLVEYTNDPTSGAAITKGFNNAALAYTSSATFASFNGGSVTTNSSIPGTLTSSAANRLIIGGAQVVGAQLQGYISQLIYYPRRLSNTYLQELTR